MRTTSRIVRPVFVVGSPRSGTTLVQNLLCRDPEVYRLGRESRFLWHRLDGQEVTGAFPGRGRLEQAYLSELFREEQPWSRQQLRRWAERRASQGTPVQYLDLPHDLLDELGGPGVAGPFAGTVQTETAPFTVPPAAATFASETTGDVRMVDKDTGHCWRLPELAEAFPDAQFVVVVRDPLPAVRSLVAGWRHPTWFFTYRLGRELRIAGYSERSPWGDRWWNFNLFPGYDSLLDATLEEVCGQQWASAMAPVVRHGRQLAAEGRAVFIRYEHLVAAPGEVLAGLAAFTGLDRDRIVGDGLTTTYMSMLASTWDPGGQDAHLAAVADEVRSVLAPVADLLDPPGASSQGVEDPCNRRP